MGCFPCFGSSKEERKRNKTKGRGTKQVGDLKKEAQVAPSPQQLTRISSGSSFFPSLFEKSKSRSGSESKMEVPVVKERNPTHTAAKQFSFHELAAATQNFKQECLLGHGDFGPVYKGRLTNGQVVAVKQLDRNGLQGNTEFLVEVLMLNMLHHPNIVNLVCYCTDGDQCLIVYEFMPLGALEEHLHDLPPDKEPLDWNTRMKIAAGVAKGLEHLHDEANPPVIHRNLKSSNILLGEGYHPKLSDFGLAKLDPVGDETHVSTGVMCTDGYCDQEYAMTGLLTLKSDIYSFGVVLLEIITGRKAIDNTRPAGEQNLVAWARPLFKDRMKFPKMADPLMQCRYPMRDLYQAMAVAAMCLQEQAATRPLICDVVTALTYLASQTYDPNAASCQSNRISSSTTRAKAEHRVPDNPCATDSPRQNSPDWWQRDDLRGVNLHSEVGRGDTGGSTGRMVVTDEAETDEYYWDKPVHSCNGKDAHKGLN